MTVELTQPVARARPPDSPAAKKKRNNIARCAIARLFLATQNRHYERAHRLTSQSTGSMILLTADANKQTAHRVEDGREEEA